LKVKTKQNIKFLRIIFISLLDCFYVPFFRDNNNFESFVAKPVRDDKIIDMKGSPNDNLRTKILTAFVGPTSPSKV
jgi:hypothetical protein